MVEKTPEVGIARSPHLFGDAAVLRRIETAAGFAHDRIRAVPANEVYLRRHWENRAQALLRPSQTRAAQAMLPRRTS